jgi:hypothetical protein
MLSRVGNHSNKLPNTGIESNRLIASRFASMLPMPPSTNTVYFGTSATASKRLPATEQKETKANILTYSDEANFLILFSKRNKGSSFSNGRLFSISGNSFWFHHSILAKANRFIESSI